MKYDKLFEIAEQYGLDMKDLELGWANEINAVENKKKKKDEKKNIETAKKAAVETAQIIADTTYEIASRKREAETDHRLSELDRQKNAELEAVEGNEAAKDEINKRYAELERAEKTRAWEANRKAAIKQAIINGLVAATNIWATTPKMDFGVSTYIMLGLAAATTVANVAALASEPTPEFEKGVRGFR